MFSHVFFFHRLLCWRFHLISRMTVSDNFINGTRRASDWQYLIKIKDLMSERQSSSRLNSAEPAGMFHTEDNTKRHLFEQVKGEPVIVSIRKQRRRWAYHSFGQQSDRMISSHNETVFRVRSTRKKAPEGQKRILDLAVWTYSKNFFLRSWMSKDDHRRLV